MGKFASQLDEFLEDFKRKIDTIAQFYVSEAGTFLVDATPVITGKLRGGWYVRINSNQRLPSLPVDPSGEFTKALIIASAGKVRWGDRVDIVNDVSYGYYVDQGTLKFEGRAMVARTIVHLRSLRPPL